MQPARDQTHRTEELHLVFLACPVSIRENLAHLMQARPLSDLSDDSRGSAELVLAEVLNNVAEHAYPEGQGPVSISLVRAAAGISCLIVDQGAPMPGGALPVGQPPPAQDAALEDMPEGGLRLAFDPQPDPGPRLSADRRLQPAELHFACLNAGPTNSFDSPPLCHRSGAVETPGQWHTLDAALTLPPGIRILSPPSPGCQGVFPLGFPIAAP